jgi:hypothetical protein
VRRELAVKASEAALVCCLGKPAWVRVSVMHSVLSCTLCMLLSHVARVQKESKVACIKKATASKKQTAAEVLMKAMAHKNIPFRFVTSPQFQSYVDYVSGSVFSAPTRYELVKALEQICATIATKVRNQLRRSPDIGVCVDGWTSAGRHLAAVTAGNPGCTIYLNSYENLGNDSAEAYTGMKGTYSYTLGTKV